MTAYWADALGKRAETYTLDALSRAASGLYKAKGGHYDIKSEGCIVSHQGQQLCGHPGVDAHAAGAKRQ